MKIIKPAVAAMLFCFAFLSGTTAAAALDVNEVFRKANDYFNKGDYDNAIAEYTRGIQIAPSKAVGYINRGNAYSAKGEDDRAITDYTKAIELDLKYALAYYNRGNAYKAKGEYDKAIMDYKKRIELSPEDGYARIWYFLATQGVSNAMANSYANELREDVKANGSNEWIRSVSKFYLSIDNMTEEALINEARRAKNAKEVTERLCEAYYYIGEERLFRGDKAGAKKFFGMSVDTKVFGLYEYDSAKARLKALKQGKL